MTVLELARSGAALAGTVSVHGSLETARPAEPSAVHGKILVCHGALDPHVPMTQVTTFTDEMKHAGVDYQLIVYGSAMHGFTHETATGQQPGLGEQHDAQRGQHGTGEHTLRILEERMLYGRRVPDAEIHWCSKVVAGFLQRPWVQCNISFGRRYEASNSDRRSHLTKSVQPIAFGSWGLPILSRKGRGRVPQAQSSLEASGRRAFTSPLAGEDSKPERDKVEFLGALGEGLAHIASGSNSNNAQTFGGVRALAFEV